MSIPPADHREGLDEVDPLILERQRRRYASRAIAYLVLLNGVAALILLATLPKLAAQVPEPRGIVDAMLVFGAGTATALGSTFFAYLRRTVRLQAPERVPLRVSLWWLSVVAAIVAGACFLIGLNMAGRAALPEQAGISSGAHFKGDKERKDQSRVKREGREDGKREKRDKDDQRAKGEEGEGKKEGEREQGVQQAPTKPEQNSKTETVPAGPQPLSRTACEEAGRTWNESTNTCN